MSVKSKTSKIQKDHKKSKGLEETYSNPDVQLVKKIASISERAEKIRSPLIPNITRFYKV